MEMVSGEEGGMVATKNPKNENLKTENFENENLNSESDIDPSRDKIFRLTNGEIESIQHEEKIEMKQRQGRPLFLCCESSYWMMARRGDMVFHPQHTDNVVAFTAFHNVNCTFGCIYYTSSGHLKICQLPSAINYSSEWLVQKVPLRATARCLAIQPQSSLVVAAVSYKVPPEKKPPPPPPVAEDEQPKPQYDWRQAHELLVFRGPHYEIIDRYAFEVGENALVVRYVSLKDRDGTAREMLAVGTAFIGVEDQAVKGNITLLELVRDADGLKHAEEHVQLRHVLSKEIKGAISAV